MNKICFKREIGTLAYMNHIEIVFKQANESKKDLKKEKKARKFVMRI